MTFFSRLAIIYIFLFISISGVVAQHNKISIDEVYGSDPLLYNGRVYRFFPPLNTLGNQFFADPQFEAGSVTIRGVVYTSLKLNYDIYNQQLILEYKNNLGATSLIVVSDAWLENFSFKGLNFEMITLQDTIKRIFQVLGTGPNKILFSWKKALDLESSYGSKNHAFSKPKKEMNLLTGNKILKYWNNKSFYYLLAPEIKTNVKDYIHRHKIKVKKASDQTMTELIYYCNTLYGK
jgi:hypothetical protein